MVLFGSSIPSSEEKAHNEKLDDRLQNMLDAAMNQSLRVPVPSVLFFLERLFS